MGTISESEKEVKGPFELPEGYEWRQPVVYIRTPLGDYYGFNPRLDNGSAWWATGADGQWSNTLAASNDERGGTWFFEPRPVMFFGTFIVERLSPATSPVIIRKEVQDGRA